MTEDPIKLLRDLVATHFEGEIPNTHDLGEIYNSGNWNPIEMDCANEKQISAAIEFLNILRKEQD